MSWAYLNFPSMPWSAPPLPTRVARPRPPVPSHDLGNHYLPASNPAYVVATALDNGQCSTRKQLAAVVRSLTLSLKPRREQRESGSASVLRTASLPPKPGISRLILSQRVERCLRVLAQRQIRLLEEPNRG